MATLILSHDLGTTGDKATLFRSDGTLVAATLASYPTSYPSRGGPSRMPGRVLERVLPFHAPSSLPRLHPGEIGVVSFSGQMMAALPVDHGGNPLRPSIIWADQRATAEAAELAGGSRPTGSTPSRGTG